LATGTHISDFYAATFLNISTGACENEYRWYAFVFAAA
jgi:hypothetical protein